MLYIQNDPIFKQAFNVVWCQSDVKGETSGSRLGRAMTMQYVQSHSK